MVKIEKTNNETKMNSEITFPYNAVKWALLFK
jgi:hypothetical protein